LLAFINIHLIAASLERSVSGSRQFIAYGATTPLRGAVCDLAERTKKNLLAILQQRDQWKTPVVLNLQFPQANLPEIPLAARYFSQTGSGLKLQLDLTIGADVDVLVIQREILRALLLEMMYRRHPDLPAGTVYVQPPEWLVEGVLVAAPGQDRAPLVEALAPLLTSNKVTPLPEFLRQNPALLDSPAQLLYRAYAFALLQFLIDEPAGPSHLAAFIDDLCRASNDPFSDLKAHFPVLASSADIDALWKSKVATLGAARDYELLTFAETERRLKGLLEIRVPAMVSSAKTVRLEQLLSKKISTTQAGELRRVSRSLMQLATTANPVIRPIVTEYQQIVELMVDHRTKGLGPRLTRLNSTSAHLSARMSNIDDYMNWFEATKSSTTSGAFSRYLKAAKRSTDPEIRRHDSLSVYLDALEGQF
jgi:hypothetical protein